MQRKLPSKKRDNEHEKPALPSPRLTSPGCTCFQNITLNKGKYVPKTCALHSPLEFGDEKRPSIYETINELQKHDVDDVDELRPESVKPVTIPYDIANEMVEQYSMLLKRLEERHGSDDDIDQVEASQIKSD